MNYSSLAGTAKSIAYGDRIYARISYQGQACADFFTETATTVSEVKRQLAAKVAPLRGLCKIYIRNHSRGWAIESPCLLRS